MGGWNRHKSPLEALCFWCDQQEHSRGKREDIPPAVRLGRDDVEGAA